MDIRTASGRPVDGITLEAVMSGEITASDVRIHPDTLRHQAEVAERHGNRQLGQNLRRAAELVSLSDGEVLRIYEALRPHRSSAEELQAIAECLDAADAQLCADLMREAAEVYEARGLLRPE